jgi:hypothetical protein
LKISLPLASWITTSCGIASLFVNDSVLG